MYVIHCYDFRLALTSLRRLRLVDEFAHHVVLLAGQSNSNLEHEKVWQLVGQLVLAETLTRKLRSTFFDHHLLR